MRLLAFACLTVFTGPLAATGTIKQLSYKDKEIQKLRSEMTQNLRLLRRGDRFQIRWRTYTVRDQDNFFKIMAKTMQNHDTLSSVNRLASIWDIRKGDKWLIPNIRGIALYGSKHKLAKEYKVSLSKILNIPGKKGLYFIAGFRFKPEARKLFRLESFIRPVTGPVSSRYGLRRDPFHNKRSWHNGIDIACPKGSKVKASASGKVIFAGWRGGYGRAVIIEHYGGYQTLYGHLKTLKVKKGQKVKQGQVVAHSGNTGRTTGPHLHFELRRKGRAVRPLFNHGLLRRARRKTT